MRYALSRVEIGSIEANVLESTVYRNQPAIKVRERLSAMEVLCVFSTAAAELLGPQHSWTYTWARRRFILTGRISYNRAGKIFSIYVIEIEDIDPRPLKYRDIADPNFTGGPSPSDYIDSVWEDAVGTPGPHHLVFGCG